MLKKKAQLLAQGTISVSSTMELKDQRAKEGAGGDVCLTGSHKQLACIGLALSFSSPSYWPVSKILSSDGWEKEGAAACLLPSYVLCLFP